MLNRSSPAIARNTSNLTNRRPWLTPSAKFMTGQGDP